MSPHRPTQAAVVLATLLATLLASCSDSKGSGGPTETKLAPDPPAFTASTSVSTLLGRANFSDPWSSAVQIHRTTGNWNIDLQAQPSFDIAVQTIDFAPGATSGWHSHPGPVFIQVVSGTMTFYESDDSMCAPEVFTAGQGYLDMGEHAHIARNETSQPARNIVTYFAPPGAALRIDQPRPGNCPF